MFTESLLRYYQQNKLNPVPIAVEDKATWESHVAKRFNLYQRHLRIPLTLLRDRSVLEFGCGSGENALVLATFGANLTLVEPNEQVLPRLRKLFKKFGLEKRIVRLIQGDINSFTSEELYDIVIAEGFLCTLSNRDELILKISRLLAPGGLAVISFNDRYGSLLESTKKLLLWRVCQLAKIDNVHSEGSLKLARKLFWQEFTQLNASRPFEVWWKDMLVNPFFASEYLWSYAELFPLLQRAGCEFYSSSPKWNSVEHFEWYKNVLDRDSRHKYLLDDWKRTFSYFLTGISTSNGGAKPATSEIVNSVSGLVSQISEYTTDLSSSIELVSYPHLLDEYFRKSKDSRLLCFNSEMKRLYDVVKRRHLDDLISVYREAKCIRRLWGVPYHYICFNKMIDANFKKRYEKRFK